MKGQAVHRGMCHNSGRIQIYIIQDKGKVKNLGGGWG